MQLNKVEIEETENQNKSWKTHQIAFFDFGCVFTFGIRVKSSIQFFEEKV